MTFWHIFLAFFIPGIVGYGGGPASIPLVENEVVDRYEWMSTEEFSEVLALANALPGPIATKMAGFIGFDQGGWFGAVVGIFASVAPSLLLMILLLKLLLKYKDSQNVKWMTILVRPTIAVLLGIMAYQFFFSSYENSGWLQSLLLVGASYLFLVRLKIHPAFVIVGALTYGGIFL
ncbi:chromate transporter [Alkalihalobacillus sp. AL-G]|uniref:chromate transporter n=1 Tax=Alkalihalobacillus sp. AL-G TaxID=2926399 RepID=UPI0027299A46|nr:chromate transporter [Alkalihalobacillus sp. AL-G]WLD93154.1 chromate transporter [Alkalihalobacillus sp. AL-G]